MELFRLYKSRLNIFPCCQTTGMNFSHKKDMIILYTKILPENNRFSEGKRITAVPVTH